VLRLFVTGTDPNVGKTRVTAAVARAFVMGGEWPTIMKLVQTGLAGNAPGDAAEAGALAGCPFVELARFARPADPRSASLAGQCEPLDAATLAGRLEAFADPLIVEGAGGAAVPLNSRESLADVVAHARCDALVAVGLRLGCINHALLTLDYLAARGVVVRGVVFVERWEPMDDAYRADVERTLTGRAPLLGVVAHDGDTPRSVAPAAALFAALVA
jgi:dethiobiotin synthetase